jgi:hypothetical protein
LYSKLAPPTYFPARSQVQSENYEGNGPSHRSLAACEPTLRDS